MSGYVMVANSTYEIISQTRVSRAISLVIRGDAVIEESDPLKQIRHATGSFPYPKLIRLLRFVKIKVKYGPQQWTKRGVLKRDNYCCGYCGRTATTIDHITPQSRGGARRCWMNTVAACAKCNNKKRDRTPQEARMTLHVTPSTPMGVQLRF